jgi:hypothetical protein
VVGCSAHHFTEAAFASRIRQRHLTIEGGAKVHPTKILLGFLILAGSVGAIRDYDKGQSLGEIMTTDFVFTAIGVIGLWLMRNDKESSGQDQ